MSDKNTTFNPADPFVPAVRFIVVSDIHYSNVHDKERDCFERALAISREIAENSPVYKKLDAIFVVGDFATSGSEIQMQAFRDSLDRGLQDDTLRVLMMASHEWKDEGGEAGAHERFARIFNMPPDDHHVINGFHFISLTTTNGCRFSNEKVAYAARELKKAREADPKKPIFFFQHPHIIDTVYGSICWGERALYQTLMNYPQVIDFSGHSHAPINDPRSIHQKHFTSLGTGSFHYFELDEFDKIYGTVPPDSDRCAQFLIVEADDNGRVRVYPYDVVTENFFPYVWKIDEPWNPDSFLYTDERYKTCVAPYFDNDFRVTFDEITEHGFRVTFTQAKIKKDYVNDYIIRVIDRKTGAIVKQTGMWSGYYFYDMPQTLSWTFDDLEPATNYDVQFTAGSFWKTKTESGKYSVRTL